ncbi:hypothetical protein ACWGH3_37830 [Streptomyces sp. NPDC054884]
MTELTRTWLPAQQGVPANTLMQQVKCLPRSPARRTAPCPYPIRPRQATSPRSRQHLRGSAHARYESDEELEEFLAFTYAERHRDVA